LSREPRSWCWKNSLGVEFKIERIVDQTKVPSIAIVIALSSDISIDRIPGEYSIIYKIHTDNMTVDCIENKESLRNFWKCYQTVCDEIINKYGKEVDVGLFPAIPVSAAFEIGRRYMRGVYPVITLYDNNDGLVKTIKLGEEDGK
ncbi:MAG: SAVED domain-containing protein, partial [Erysipelotrichales bacterium]|nr:SAVED domain-containing protein [Erysipelotrichales bacterium]